MKCYAQNPEWINYSNYDKVFDICDNGQFLWIGSEGGLVKLNKNTEEITCYNRANSGIPDNHILSLAIDSVNNIWLGTKYYGIGKFNGENCAIYNMENSDLPFDQWNTEIEIDSHGNIWIGSLKYLSIFNGTIWKIYETGSPFSSFTAINDIYFDKQGNTWIGATWGLGKIADGALIENFEGFDKEIEVIKSDANNTLWIGTHYNGLFRYDGINWTVYDTTNSGIPANNIYDMEFDKNGNLWIASSKGLIKFDGFDWIVHDTINSDLLDNIILSLEIDGDGILWIGLINNGLMRFDGMNWKEYHLSNTGLPTNYIYAIEIDQSQNVWIGTYQGLVKFYNNKWNLYNEENSGLKNSFLQSLKSSINGDLWIGSRGYNCLTQYDGINWTVFDSTNSILKEEIVESIKEDAEGNIWLATWRGVVKYDGNKWTRYDHTNTPMTSPVITDILFDSKGNLWVGCATVPYVEGWVGCLAKFTGSEWTNYSKDNSGLPDNHVSCLTIDSEDNLWVGTKEGLVKFDNNNNWTVYNTYNSGLPYNSILRVFCKYKDTLWIGTAYGLSRFVDEKDWSTFQVINSGLAHNYVCAINEDKNGNIWIAHHTPGGLSVFREGGVILSTHENNYNYTVNSFSLSQNYPNPFNPKTTITFSLPQSSYITLKIFDILGREVTILVNEEKPAGTYVVDFNGTGLTSGVYFYKLQTENYSSTKKLILLR